jgi:hypothetical protein
MAHPENTPTHFPDEPFFSQMKTKIFKIYLLKMFDSWPKFCRIVLFV